MRSRNQHGQLAICATTFLAVIVFVLGLFSYELAEYCLAEQQLKTSVQAAALACSTKLASLSNSAGVDGQTDAFATGANCFRMNSILGNSLIGTIQVDWPSQASTLPAGQAAISFQLLNPTSHQPAAPTMGMTPVMGMTPALASTSSLNVTAPISGFNPPAAGSVVQASATYAYVPTFAKIFADAFAPMQIACTADSGVQQLDLIIALDISGGMDDQTPVTLVQRYWDYDNNHPPHHIVYMMPAINGNPANPAEGRLGSLFNYEAPHLNGAFPQDLQIAASEPSDSQYDQNFSELPGAMTLMLRSAGSTDDQNPPGNYSFLTVGDNGLSGTPPLSIPSGNGAPFSDTITNPARELDLQNIAALVNQIDTSDTWNYSIGNAENSQNPWYYTSTGGYGAMGNNPPFTNPTPDQYPQQLAWYIQDAIAVTGAKTGQVIQAINVGNARAGANASCGVTSLSWQLGSGDTTEFLERFSLKPGPASVFTGLTAIGMTPSTGSGHENPPSGYWRYGFYFASGSSASNANEVIVPSGTQGPSNGAPSYTPSVAWGPYNYNAFTDLVVNLDGNDQFLQGATSHFTYNGYSFPSLGSVIEAARGNLESFDTAQAAGLDLDALGVMPQSGYKNAYQQAALAQVQPLSSLTQTVPSFMSQLSQFGDVSFGLITFNDDTGTTSSQIFADSNVSPDYPKGGTNSFQLPGVSLGVNNTGTITSTIQGMSVGGGRNVAKSIQSALTMFASSGRQGAQKAIVLITDGPPTVDLEGQQNSATALSDARSQSALARAQGVPVYCISISSNNQSQSDEQSIYNDSNRDVSAGGLAAISGQGARYYPLQYNGAASTTTTLNQTFGNITRQLNSLLINQQQVALQQ